MKAQTEDQIRKRWPEATDTDVDRIIRYQRGDAHQFKAPDVCPARWDDLAWSRAVTFTGE